MGVLTALKAVKYGLVLMYGVFLSVDIAGGCDSRRQERLVLALCPLFLLVQGVGWLLFGDDAVRQVYPLIVHLPLLAVLVFGLKKSVGVAAVSVCIGYLCCQLPRWVNLAVTALSGSALMGEVGHILSMVLGFFLLHRCFVRAAHEAMSGSVRSLLLFGSLPLAYYVFDYATAVYSDALYVGVQALNEFLPTALILFYVLFLTAYHVQARERVQAELQRSMLEAELKQSQLEMEGLRRAETQAAIYQHDMRHHLTTIGAFLTAGRPEQAVAYIQKAEADVAAITPKRFCENELINLLCSSFSGKAEREGVRLTVEARLPEAISISDTELCSVVSNGLENALCAVHGLEPPHRWVAFYCAVKRNKLLIEIKNPYAGEVVMQDGMPRSKRAGHGYGCRSIHTIAELHRGLCAFETENGIFMLRVVLPVMEEQ